MDPRARTSQLGGVVMDVVEMPIGVRAKRFTGRSGNDPDTRSGRNKKLIFD